MQRKHKMTKKVGIYYSIRFLLAVGVIFGLNSCGSDRFDVDVSEVNVNLEWNRLDREFFQLRPNNYELQQAELTAKYGSFYKRYVENVLQLGMLDDPALKYSVASFLSNKDVIDVADEVEKEFSNLEAEKKALEMAFRYYQYHFPEKSIPQVVSFLSGFDSKVAATDRFLGIGLDLYLGKEHEFYTYMKWPDYKRAQMVRERIPYDAMRGWLLTEFDSAENENDLISRMIVYGRVLYAMDAMFYGKPDHLKIGYSAQDLAWCEENQTHIWGMFIESEKLFSSNTNDIRRYISEGPFTPGMPKESPAQVSYWVGWEIVKSFMEENPSVTLPQLMEMPINGREFLTQSKYKPV